MRMELLEPLIVAPRLVQPLLALALGIGISCISPKPIKETLGVVASYRVNRETGVVSGPALDILDAENATCWLVISNDGTVGYATNTGSASVSTFNINFDGTMTPFKRRFNVQTGAGPLDLVLSRDGANVYTLNSGDNEIRNLQVRNDGSLSRKQTVYVPVGANGLAVR